MLGVVVLTVIFLFFKEFQLASFDPVLAHMLGKRPETLRFAMLILLSLTIVVGLQPWASDWSPPCWSPRPRPPTCSRGAWRR